MKAYFAKEIITESGSLYEAFLVEDHGKIAGIVKKPAQNIPVVTYEKCIIAPGLIDVHTHGALGYETGFGEKSSLSKWTEYQITHGVTGFLPSTGIDSPGANQKSCSRYQGISRPTSYKHSRVTYGRTVFLPPDPKSALRILNI